MLIIFQAPGVLTTLFSNIESLFYQIFMSERVKKVKKSDKVDSSNSKSGYMKRPCENCLFFRRLGGRFGVCDRGNHPSAPTACVLFRKDLSRI